MTTEAGNPSGRVVADLARPEQGPRGPSSSHPAIASLHADDRALLAAHDEASLVSLGLPSHDLAGDRVRASAQVMSLLGLRADQIRFSPLGPAWSSDLDISATGDASQLHDAGWLSADSFLRNLGSPGSGRWLVRSDGRVIGQVDFEARPDAPTRDDRLEKIVARAREQGHVTLREVLELRGVARSGRAVPENEITRAAARLERFLAGARDVRLELSGLADRPEDGPIRIRNRAVRRRAAAVRRWGRPRTVIALSGVDGAGKSSLTAALVQDFQRMGLAPDVIWARPGMRMEWIEPILRTRSKRRVPTVARVASGQHVEAASRRGLIGWAWAMLVTGTFLAHIWCRHLARSGVKIYDRHLDDAIITLDFVYAGVDLRVQRKLIGWLLPRASITLYLSIDADTAVRRKPGDTFGQHAVESQLRHYAERMRARPEVTVLDATRDPRDIASEALARIIECAR